MASGTYARTGSGGRRVGGRSRARAEQACWQRAERWLAKRQEERRSAAQAITARIARQRLEARS